MEPSSSLVSRCIEGAYIATEILKCKRVGNTLANGKLLDLAAVYLNIISRADKCKFNNRSIRRIKKIEHNIHKITKHN